MIRWVLAIAVCAALTAWASVAALSSPAETDQERAARWLYVHVPAAMNTALAFTVAAGASAVVLWRRSDRADRLARSAAAVGLGLCTLMLGSGMAWARTAWGHWWDPGSAKLTLSAVLWLLFVAYFLLRRGVRPGRRRRRVAAVYCLIAFLDVPLVWLSTHFATGDIHAPSVAALDIKPASYGAVLALAMVAMTAVHAVALLAALRAARVADSKAATSE